MKISIQAGTEAFRIADRTVVVAGIGCFEGRLLNQPDITRVMSRAGTMPLTINLSIRNDDGFIPDSVDLWAATVSVVTDTGFAWQGKITAYDSDGVGTLYAVVTEKTAPELTIQIPDEVARVVTVDENYHQSALNVTLPIAVGGTVASPIALKGVLINKTQGVYLICVGEIRQFVSIRVGDVTIPIAEAAAAGYLSFVGTADQADYPRIAYVQIADEALRKNDDGTYVEIGANVVGIKLGSHSAEECRNGARFLYYLLTQPHELGWGLGVADYDIDLDSFTESIGRVDAAGLKLDGVLYFRQSAQSWIDQICQAIRGYYEIGVSGKRRLFVDASAASVKTYTAKDIKLLRTGKGSYSNLFNRGRLDFGYNPITGAFLQTAFYENTASIEDIGEQEFQGQSYLIRDMATAQAILEYTCKKSLVGAQKVYFETQTLPASPRTGMVITIDYPEKNLSGTWQITKLELGSQVHKIEVEKIDASIFSSGTPGTAIDWNYDPPVVSISPPASPSELELSSGVRIQGDGTAIAYVDGTYAPGAGSLFVRVEVGEGANPDSWTEIAVSKDGNWHHEPVKLGQQYTYRLTAVNVAGQSPSITAGIVTATDTTAPGTPKPPVLTLLFKSVRIKALQNATKAPDLAGFRIFRHTSDAVASSTEIGFQPCGGTEDGAVFLDERTAFGQTYYYWTKAVDRTGNASDFSATAGPVTTSQIVAGDLGAGSIDLPAVFAGGVVDGAAIADCAVTAAKTAIAAINRTTGNLAAGAICAAGMFGPGVIDAAAIGAGAVTAVKTSLAGIDSTTGAIAAGAVGTAQLVDAAVCAAKLADCAVTAAKTAFAAVDRTTGQIASGAICAASMFATGVVNAAAIASGAVTAVKTCLAAICNTTGALKTGSVGTTQLVDGAVCTAKIAAAAVVACLLNVAAINSTTGALNSGTVDAAQLVSSAVTEAKLAAAAVTASKTNLAAISNTTGTLNSNTVDTAQIVAAAVTAAKTNLAAINSTTGALNSGTVDAAQLVTSAVTEAKLAAGSVSCPKIAAGAISACHISAAAITAGAIAACAIATCHLAAGAVTAAKIGACAIEACHISACAVTADAIAVGAIVAGKLAANSVAAGNICAGAIAACHISAAAVTAGAIAACAICSCHLSAGSVTTGALLVLTQGASLTADPHFTDSSAWIITRCAAMVTIGDGCAGAGAMRTCIVAGCYGLFSVSKWVPISSDKCYRYRFMARLVAASPSDGCVWARVYSNCNNCGHTYNFWECRFPNTSFSCDWATYHWYFPGTCVSARGGTSAQVYMLAGAGGTCGCIEFQDLRLEEVVPGTLIVDGAITASKISAGAISACHLAAGAVCAGSIAAGAVCSCHLSANAVTATAIAAGAVCAGKIAAAAVYGCNLVAGTLCAAQIGACQVCACHLVAGLIQSTHLASGSVTTGALAVGAITADKILVSAPGAALNRDPGTQDATAWTAFCGAFAVCVEAAGKVGTSVMQSATADAWICAGQATPLDPAKTYRVSAWVNRKAPATGCFYLAVALQTSAGANIAGAGTWWLYPASGVCPAADTWTWYCGLFGAGTAAPFPGTARTMKPGVILSYGGGVAGYQVQDVRIEEAVPATLVADGAITTDKIYANAVTASKIAACAIAACHLTAGELITFSAQIRDGVIVNAKIACLDAGKVNTGTLAADRIAAGSLSADKISGTALVIGGAAGDVNAGATCIAGGKITASSITSCQLAAGSVLAQSIASGAVVACHLAAGAVTAAALAVSAPGMAINRDPGFSEPSGLWIQSCGVIVSGSGGPTGGCIFQTRCNAYSSVQESYLTPIDPNKCYRRSVWLRGVNGTGGRAYFYDCVYDSSGCAICTHCNQLGCPTTLWTRFEWVTQYPSNARYVRVKLDINNGTPGASVYTEAQDNRLEEVLPGTLIQDGAITTDKIFAGAITAAKIAAGAVTTSALLVAAPGSALNQDPAMQDPGAWSVMDGFAYACWGLATTSTGCVGTGVLRGCNNVSMGTFVDSRFIPIDRSKTYRLRALIRRSAAAANGCIYLSVREYNTSYVNLSSNAGTYVVVGATPGTSWAEVCGLIGPGTATAFNGATAFVRVGGLINYFTTCGYHEIQDLRLEEILPATLIKDGAITAAKITAGAICTCHLAAAGISADCITAGVMSANRISAGTLSATVCLAACQGTMGGWQLCAGEIQKCAAYSPNNYGIVRLYVGEGGSTSPFIQSYAQYCCTSCYIMAMVGATTGTSCDFGLLVRTNAGTLFQATKNTATGDEVTKLGGWNFNPFCIFAGSLILDSTGSIRGNYCAGSTGWCVSYTGSAEFNDVVVRGTVCSCCGVIGGLTIGCSSISGIGCYVCCSIHHGAAIGTSAGNALMNVVSYCFGPYTYAHVCIGAGYSINGICADCALIRACVPTTDRYAMCTNGRIQASAFCVVSDFTLKDDLEPITVLPKLRDLNIFSWRFRDQSSFSRHIGPMAQDFHRVFPKFSDDSMSIPMMGGFALRAVQELDSIVSAQASCIKSLEQRLANIESHMRSAA